MYIIYSFFRNTVTFMIQELEANNAINHIIMYDIYTCVYPLTYL